MKKLLLLLTVTTLIFVACDKDKTTPEAIVTVSNSDTTYTDTLYVEVPTTYTVTDTLIVNDTVCTSTISITDVHNPVTGETWMDRNLGAAQVATNTKDELSFGWLYQWGRDTDGHQKRTATTQSDGPTSSTPTPNHDIYIGMESGTGGDWLIPHNDNLWQGVNGINNPCPTGYRIPTITEWEAEISSWYSEDSLGAFSSPLKLPIAGERDGNGGISSNSTNYSGSYWSSTIDTDPNSYYSNESTMIKITSDYVRIESRPRAYGLSIRCIKD